MVVNQEMPTKNKMNPLVIVVIVVVVIIILGFALMTAGSIFFVSKLKQAAQKAGVQYSAGNNSFNYKDKEGNAAVVGAAAKLPDNFPKDFPIYSEAKVVSAITVKDAFSVTFNIPTNRMADVLNWYEKEMAANGWKADPHAAGAQLMTFKKDRMTALLLFVAQDKGGIYFKATISTK